MRIQYPAQESGAIHITRALPHNTTTSLSTELATKPTSTTGLTTKPDDLNETGAGYTVKRKPTDTNTTTNLLYAHCLLFTMRGTFSSSTVWLFSD